MPVSLIVDGHLTFGQTVESVYSSQQVNPCRGLVQIAWGAYTTSDPIWSLRSISDNLFKLHRLFVQHASLWHTLLTPSLRPRLPHHFVRHFRPSYNLAVASPLSVSVFIYQINESSHSALFTYLNLIQVAIDRYEPSGSSAINHR